MTSVSNTNLLGNWWETDVAKNILEKKYYHNGEDFNTFIDRVSGAFRDDVTKASLKEAMISGDFMPGGSILSGIGVKDRKISLNNCYVMPSPKDELASIFDVGKEMGIIFSRRGGCGVNLSKLRPKGARVHNSAITSTGAVSFVQYYDNMASTIGAEGRRAALLVALKATHPDIADFLKLKANDTSIQMANLSVIFNDDFMGSVYAGDMYTLHFKVEDTGEEIKKEIDARKLFMEFCELNRRFAEPGAIFIDTVRDYNMLSAYPKEEYLIECCNPCVTGDTKILTDKGYLEIKDLVGVQTNIWNGYEWSKVTPKITGYNQKMRHIKLSNGMELDCTNYHKFVMKDGSRVKAVDLQVGDKLAKWEYPVIDCFDYDMDNAYTAGFYCGDGTKHKNQIKLYGKKQSLIEFLDVKSSCVDTGRDTTSIVLNNNYSKNFVPFNVSVKSRLEWLAGLIDSDGCMNSSEGSIAITSIDMEFLYKVQMMLSTLGCHSSVALCREEGYRELPCNDGTGSKDEYFCQPLYRLVISAYNVQSLLSLGLDLHRVDVKPTPNRNASRFVYVIENIAIEDAEIVYCFNEPLNHTGIFNGIMTAQCAEYYGAEYNACCLGSINLFNCVENPCTGNATFDFGKLRYLTSLGVRVLDEVLDIGYDAQPLDAHRKAIKDWRAIGLGVMGMADMLVAMGFEYGSKEANKFLEDVFREIRDMSLIESSCLAKSFGSFGNFDSEKVLASRFFHTVPDRIKGMIKKYGLRNGNLMSIAPSGTISTMIGVSNGVEPYFKVSYTRSTHTNVNEGTGKTFEVFAKAVELLMKKQNIKSHSELPDYIVDTYQINPFDRVITQGRIQEYVDNAISSTVNVKESTTTEEIFAIYMKAWTEGCKGLTIFRENCERTSIIDNKEGKKNTAPSPSLSKELVPEKRSGIKKLNGCTIVESTSCVPKMYVTINQKDGKPFEVFTASDSGCKSNIATITRMTSAMLRLGVPVDYVVKQLRQSSCLACQTLRKQGKEISLSCGNAIADAIEESLKPEAKKRKPAEEKIGMAKCPECGEYSLVPTGKCVYCPQCGYSRC